MSRDARPTEAAATPAAASVLPMFWCAALPLALNGLSVARLITTNWYREWRDRRPPCAHDWYYVSDE